MYQLVAYTMGLALSETIAMTSLTKYSKSYNPYYLIAGSVIYGIVIPYLLLSSLNSLLLLQFHFLLLFVQ